MDKNPLTLTPDTSVTDALAQLKDAGIGGAAVADASGTVMGFFSLRHLLENTLPVSMVSESAETLQCAILHDTLEDTQTTYEELVEAVGSTVADLVMEVTDDKSLPKPERKRLQAEHSPHLTPKAKVVKLADKIANIQDVGSDQSPSHWDEARRIEYLDWAESVAAGLMGTNEPLDTLFRSEIGRLRSKLSLVEK